MLDPLTAAAVLIIAPRAAARAIPPRRPERFPVPLDTGRPRHVDHPLFTYYRGAVCTTQEQAARYLAADPGALYLLAGVLWPARQFLNKLVLITGKPDSGKTVLMRSMMGSVADLFRGNRSRPIGEERWFRRLTLMSSDGLREKFQHTATLRAAA